MGQRSGNTGTTPSATVHFIWLGDIPVAQITQRTEAGIDKEKTEILYLHSDHLNTPRLATNPKQTVVWQWPSSAFGEGQPLQDPDGDGQLTTLNLRFPGQYYDAESGLHYNYFRSYNPSTGRYTQSDPIGVAGGVNTFAYAGNNPLAMIDLFGLCGDNSLMQLSDKGKALLKGIEQLRLQPYNDQTDSRISAWLKGATIGYGHLIGKSEWSLYKDGITAEQAESLYVSDLAPYVNAVNSFLKVKASQQQFDALVILTYNIGISAFRKSSVLKLVNDPNARTGYPNLESAWRAWKNSEGKVNAGLINRRNSEWNIYTKGIYERW